MTKVRVARKPTGGWRRDGPLLARRNPASPVWRHDRAIGRGLRGLRGLRGGHRRRGRCQGLEPFAAEAVPGERCVQAWMAPQRGAAQRVADLGGFGGAQPCDGIGRQQGPQLRFEGSGSGLARHRCAACVGPGITRGVASRHGRPDRLGWPRSCSRRRLARARCGRSRWLGHGRAHGRDTQPPGEPIHSRCTHGGPFEPARRVRPSERPAG